MTKKRKLLICLGGVLVLVGVLLAVLVDSRDPMYQWHPATPLVADFAKIEIQQSSRIPSLCDAKVTIGHGAIERVTEWGSVNRVENVFYVDIVFERFASPHPFPLILYMPSRTYRLGSLEPGEYVFRLLANGVTVKEKAFEVVEPPED